MNTRILLVALFLIACGQDPSPASGTEGSEGGTSGTTHATNGDTDDCTLGSEGCACVDGLCLGEFVCESGICMLPSEATTSTEASTTGEPQPECGGTINGNVSIMNSAQLGQLIGVSHIKGHLQIADGVGLIPELACLEDVMSLGLGFGNDYSMMTKLHTSASLTLSGSGSTFPQFSHLTGVTSVFLYDVLEPLSIPMVTNLDSLGLMGSSSPKFADSFSFVKNLSLGGGQGDYSTLDGVLVDAMSVSNFSGTSLPMVTVQNFFEAYEAPSLKSLDVDFGDIFPTVGPQSIDGESAAHLSLQATGLTNLDDLAGIVTHTSRVSIAQNSALVDVSGLSGANMSLNYVIPQSYVSLNISESPMLCLSHAQMVVDTMALPTPAGLYGLDDQC